MHNVGSSRDKRVIKINHPQKLLLGLHRGGMAKSRNHLNLNWEWHSTLPRDTASQELKLNSTSSLKAHRRSATRIVTEKEAITKSQLNTWPSKHRKKPLAKGAPWPCPKVSAEEGALESTRKQRPKMCQLTKMWNRCKSPLFSQFSWNNNRSLSSLSLYSKNNPSK